MRVDYNKEKFAKVMICGMECNFSDMQIDRSTIPEGKYQYEVAGDDDSGGNPARVQRGVLINSFGALICDESLPLGEDGVLWLTDGDCVWL